MKSYLLIAMFSLAACGENAPQSPPRPGVVAVYSGGEISFAELEEMLPLALNPSCIEVRRIEGGGTIEELVPCFEELAKDRALEGIFRNETGDLDAAMKSLGAEYFELQNLAFLQTWAQAQIAEIAIEDDKISSYYSEHRGEFQRPAERTVWDIFRRHEDPDDPAVTIAFLNDLKRRFEAGETFGALARKYSHSETRLRDGLVGRMTEDRLPPELETIAGTLEDRQVSAPILVRGGAILLHVTDVIQRSQMPLDEVHHVIQQQLVREAVNERLEHRALSFTPPGNAVILDDKTFLAFLESQDEDAVVLDISGFQLTVAQLRLSIGGGDIGTSGEYDDHTRENLLDMYHTAVRSRLLVNDLLASSDPAGQRQLDLDVSDN